jgi:integrase
VSEQLLDRAGRRRSPVTRPGFHAGRPPANKGLRYPADPPTIEEIIAVMHAAADDAHGRRLRALIVILWRAGLRVQEALALVEADLGQRRGALLVRRGKGGRRREVGMDARPPLVKRRRPRRPAKDRWPGGRPPGASRRTSSGTRTRSSSHARACR